jgi:hypothetical protein
LTRFFSKASFSLNSFSFSLALAALTVRFTVTGIMVTPGALALTDRLLVPLGAVVELVMVSTELVPEAGFGLKPAEIPIGSPLTARLTVPI